MYYAGNKKYDIVQGGINWVNAKRRLCRQVVEIFVNKIEPFKLYGFSFRKIHKSELFTSIYFPGCFLYKDTIFHYLVYSRCSMH